MSSSTSPRRALRASRRAIAPVGIGHAPSDVAGADLVEMAVGPAHGRLDGQMQPVEPDFERHLDAAQDRGLDVVEGDLEAGDGVGAHAASFTTLHLRGPVPWQQRVQLGGSCDR